jgi:parallel beta-helix repeat protein
MNRSLPNRRAIAGLAVLALFVCAGRARATDIPSGNIRTTLTITEDSRLVGNVNCNVPLTTADANGVASCIAFGASHITLHLNGHTLSGPVTPPTNCSLPSDSTFGVGIYVNGQTEVKIEGPGVIQHFERWGILLLSSSEVTVRRVTANRNCWSGVQTELLSDSKFEENLFVNNAVGSGGAPCGGICVSDSSKNVIRKCTISGNGTVNAPDGNVDFGVGLEGSSSGNQIEGNDMGGNANGVFVVDATATGNVVRRNKILGNPPAQVSVAFPGTGPIFTSADEQGFDIQDTSPAGANTFEDNLCLTYSGAASPAPCPNVAIKDNDEATSRMANPLKGQEQSNNTRAAGLRSQIISSIASLLAVALGLGLLYPHVIV